MMPSATQALGIYRRMHWTRLKRGRLRFAAIVLLALPLVGTAVVLPFARDPLDSVLDLYFRFLLPFVPALGASAMVSEEIEGKTFTFHQEIRKLDNTLSAEVDALCGMMDLHARKLLPEPRELFRELADNPDLMGA